MFEIKITKQISPVLYQKLRKQQLQMKIAQEMEEYRNYTEWDKYRLDRMSRDLDIGFLQN